MRITEELKNRINRQLNAKYSEERATAEKVFNDTVEAQKGAIIAEMEEVVATRMGRILFNKSNYREPSIESYIMNNKPIFFMEAYDRYKATTNAIYEKSKQDYEELAIQVAYQKDLSGIKDIFEAMGLTF